FQILSLRHDLIRNGEAIFRCEIEEIEEGLRVAEQQTPADLRELRQIYAMALIEKLPANIASVSLDGGAWVSFQQMISHDAFEEFLDAPVCLSNNMIHIIDNGHN